MQSRVHLCTSKIHCILYLLARLCFLCVLLEIKLTLGNNMPKAYLQLLKTVFNFFSLDQIPCTHIVTQRMSSPQKTRFPQAPRVKIPALTTPQSSPQPTDSRHHNAPPSFRHLSPLWHNTQTNTALRSPQHAESDVNVFPIDNSRDAVRPLLQDATSQKMLMMQLTNSVRRSEPTAIPAAMNL